MVAKNNTILGKVTPILGENTMQISLSWKRPSIWHKFPNNNYFQATILQKLYIKKKLGTIFVSSPLALWHKYWPTPIFVPLDSSLASILAQRGCVLGDVTGGICFWVTESHSKSTFEYWGSSFISMEFDRGTGRRQILSSAW